MTSKTSSGALAGLLLLVLALVLLARTGGDGTTSGDRDPPSEPPPSTAFSEPVVASEEEFCGQFRRLAAAQGEYAAAPDERASELLRDAADQMVATGIPATMTLPARSGYFTVLDGVYRSLGLSLDPAAVGALDEPVDAADAAFSSYLTQYCPA